MLLHTILQYNVAKKGGSEFYVAWIIEHDVVVYVTTSDSEADFVTFTISDPLTSNLTIGHVSVGKVFKYRFSPKFYPFEFFQAKSLIVKSSSNYLVVSGELISQSKKVRDGSFLALPKERAPPDHTGNYTYIIWDYYVTLAASNNCTTVTLVESDSDNEENPFQDTESLSRYYFILQEGEVITIETDIPNKLITSNQPLSVISGSYVERYDIIAEQIPPVHEWGKRFAVSPGKVESYIKSRIYFISSESNVIIFINCSLSGVARLLLQKGGYTTHYSDENDYCWIEANKGILVYFRVNSLLMVVPSFDQYSNNYFLPMFQSTGREISETTNMNIFIPKEYFQPHQIFLDGTSLEDHNLQFSPIWDNNGDIVVYATVAHFSNASLQVHSLCHSNDFAYFGVLVYGSDYGHPGGLYHPRYKGECNLKSSTFE